MCPIWNPCMTHGIRRTTVLRLQNVLASCPQKACDCCEKEENRSLHPKFHFCFSRKPFTLWRRVNTFSSFEMNVSIGPAHSKSGTDAKLLRQYPEPGILLRQKYAMLRSDKSQMFADSRLCPRFQTERSEYGSGLDRQCGRWTVQRLKRKFKVEYRQLLKLWPQDDRKK